MKSTPANAPTLAQHYRRYAVGNLVGMLAGFVSFPITTRLLSNAEFGVVGYWEVWVLLLVAILKLGAGETVMRFFPHGADGHQLAAFKTNFLFAPALVGLAVWVGALLAVATGSYLGWVDQPQVALLALVTVMINVLISHFSWILATTERSALNASSMTAWRLLSVAATLAFLALWTADATSVFVARIVAGALVLAWGYRWVRRNFPFVWQGLNAASVKEGLGYGLPMALKEAANVILVLINRAMLKWLTGDYALVGIYTIGFSLAMYIDHLISTALAQAINPVMNRVYSADGAAAVVRIKAKVLVPLVHVCVGMTVVVLVAGHDMILLIAGRDKIASAPIFIVASMFLLLQPVIGTAGSGLLLVKRSGTVFGLTAAAAVLNCLLNLALIPPFGLMGATASVCSSQLLLQIALYAMCPSELRCPPRWRTVVVALLAAASAAGLSVLCLQSLDLEAAWARLAVVMPLMGLAYAAVALTMDGSLRKLLLAGRQSLFA